VSVWLSIITINLDNAAGLQKTIESVLGQACTDFELLVIDGGSADSSVQVIRRHAHRLSHWLSEPDHGIYDAMNKGIRKATGEYCLFLNSGDYLVSPDVLQRVCALGRKEDFLLCDAIISQKGRVLFRAAAPQEITLDSFIGKTICHQATLIRRALFEQFGLYKESLRLHGDLDFFIRTMIQHDCSTHPIKIVLSDYNLDGLSSDAGNAELSRQEQESILTTAFPRRILLDYQNWRETRKELTVLLWVRSKPMLYAPLALIYRLAAKMAGFKKRFFS
jgi:glycosyltransferase involved in cell wall biosynthesis